MRVKCSSLKENIPPHTGRRNTAFDISNDKEKNCFFFSKSNRRENNV